jgi:hypothetical protein
MRSAGVGAAVCRADRDTGLRLFAAAFAGGAAVDLVLVAAVFDRGVDVIRGLSVFFRIFLDIRLPFVAFAGSFIA